MGNRTWEIISFFVCLVGAIYTKDVRWVIAAALFDIATVI